MVTREIKFRAWDEKSEQMILFNVFMGLYGYHHTIPIMQYTELKDKNGVEIYEGDLIKTPIFGVSVVVYMTGLGKFTATENNIDDGCYYFELWEHKDIEVIGNIYENRELLKSGKG